MKRHVETGADVTAVCADRVPYFPHHRFLPDEDGFSSRLIFSPGGKGEGLAATEIYLMKKKTLISLLDYCTEAAKTHFNRDGMTHYLAEGGRVCIYLHEGYLRKIASAHDYYLASMDMLNPKIMTQFFPEDRPIRTKERAEVSTYYGDEAKVSNCLVADGCYIEGELEDCVIFRGVQIGKGAKLKNCVILQDTVVEPGADLTCVIADKDAVVTRNCYLVGSDRLPIIIPKGDTV